MKYLLFILSFFISIASLAQGKFGADGAVHATGTYPIVVNRETKGASFSVASIAERNAIPINFRDTGMIVLVRTDSSFYTLFGGFTNSDWHKYTSGGGSGGGIGGGACDTCIVHVTTSADSSKLYYKAQNGSIVDSTQWIGGGGGGGSTPNLQQVTSVDSITTHSMLLTGSYGKGSQIGVIDLAVLSGIGMGFTTSGNQLGSLFYLKGGAVSADVRFDSLASSNKILQFPNANGTLIATINGIHPTNDGNIVVSGGGGTYTASNGLTMLSNNVKLGGALTGNTNITTGGNVLDISGIVNSSTVLNINNTGTGTSSGIISNTTGNGFGVEGTSVSGSGIYGFSNSSGNGGTFEAVSGNAIVGIVNNASTSSILTNTVFQRGTNGTAANGIGQKLQFNIETNDFNQNTSNEIISKWTDVTGISPTSELSFTGSNSGTIGTLLTLSGDGKAKLNKYGLGTFTGTPAYPLQVDVNGNIIEGGVIRLKSYTVSTLPAGVQGQVAYVTDATSPTYLVTVAGGGSVITPVFFNGTNWICH